MHFECSRWRSSQCKQAFKEPISYVATTARKQPGGSRRLYLFNFRRHRTFASGGNIKRPSWCNTSATRIFQNRKYPNLRLFNVITTERKNDTFWEELFSTYLDISRYIRGVLVGKERYSFRVRFSYQVLCICQYEERNVFTKYFNYLIVKSPRTPAAAIDERVLLIAELDGRLQSFCGTKMRHYVSQNIILERQKR